MLAEQLWELYHEKLKHYIAKKVSDSHEVEDILQEVGIRLIKNQSSIDAVDHVEAWLFRVTRNAIIDYYRRKNKVSFIDDNNSMSTNVYNMSETDNYNMETASCILKMTDFLPENYKEAIIESDYNGVKQTILSKKWQLSNSGAKNRVQRARRKLKETLLKCCDVKSDHKGNIIELTNKKSQSEEYSCLNC